MSDNTCCTNMSEIDKHYKNANFHLRGYEKLDNVEDLQDLVNRLEGFINDIYSNAYDMHKGAVAMEERLRLYRSAIESLGFKRDLTAPKV